MNDQIEFLYRELDKLKQKKLEQKLTVADREYLKIIEEALLFIRDTLLRIVSREVSSDNIAVVLRYKNYLEAEVQKYSHRIELLTDKRAEQSYTKKIDEKLKRTREKYQYACKERDEFLEDYTKVSTEVTPKSVGESLKNLFATPVSGSMMIDSTRFGQPQNDFLMLDEFSNEMRLNRPNVLLFIEVFGEHKLDNLKKFMQIGKLKSRENTDSEQEELLSSIPKSLQGADIHVFDRVCHYNGQPWFSSLSPDDITEEMSYGNEYTSPIVNRLKIALIIDSVSNFSRNDLVAMLGEQSIVEHETIIRNQVSELANRIL